MNLSDIIIILCRASEPGNIGAVCRVMKNMGLSRLRMVVPSNEAFEPLDEAVLAARAVHAEDIWRSAVFFDTLADAVADCPLVVGTTRRRGQKRKDISMSPRALTTWLADRSAPLALVFGNERSGLSEEELHCCNAASHIPVCDAFPSINLSHAVQIYAYELYLAFGGIQKKQVKGEWTPLPFSAAEQLTKEISSTLAALGFYKQPGREGQERFLRDLICRAGLSEREGRYLKTIFEKAAMLGSRVHPQAAGRERSCHS